MAKLLVGRPAVQEERRPVLRPANKVEVEVAVWVASGAKTVGAVVAIGTAENVAECGWLF